MLGIFGNKKKEEKGILDYADKTNDGSEPKKAVETLTPQQNLAKGIPSPRDIIAPSSIEVDFNYIKVGDRYYRTLFVSGYPRFVGANWLEPIINFDFSAIISMYYYPVNARNVLDDLRRKIAEMEATINISIEKGKVIDPAVQAALTDAKSLQDQLVKGIEKYFQFSFYVTVSAPTLEELNAISYQAETTLGSLQLIAKKCTLQMEEGFQTSIPVCLDKIQILRNMDTTSVATTFPFTSSELTMNEGILYGVNKHNGSLIIFDRFSLENANTVIFAKSGSGKSYFIKLEALRSLLFGVDIIVLDPEKEYDRLCEAVGGTLIDFNVNSKAKINPFDIPITNDQEDQLGLKILSLHSLFKIMVGEMSSSESAVLDRALVDVYKLKGITQDPKSQTKEPPLMEDLYKVLLAMDEPESKILADKMERYIKGSLAGVFDQRTNIDINNSFTVFSIRNLEGILRPIAMFMILDFIWTKVKNQLKKRILIFEEAWTLMQFPDSALFVYGIVKRARKYYLGVSTITQDVADFLSSDQGKAVVTNSSLQVLMKQHPASIDRVGEVFYLSQGEKAFLLSAGIGDALFFAGTNHVAMHVKASKEENMLITTNPEEVINMQARQNALNQAKLQQQDPNDERINQMKQKIESTFATGQSGQNPMQQPVTNSEAIKNQPIIPQNQPTDSDKSNNEIDIKINEPIGQNTFANSDTITPQYKPSNSPLSNTPVFDQNKVEINQENFDQHMQSIYGGASNKEELNNPNVAPVGTMPLNNLSDNATDDNTVQDDAASKSPYPFLQNQGGQSNMPPAGMNTNYASPQNQVPPNASAPKENYSAYSFLNNQRPPQTAQGQPASAAQPTTKPSIAAAQEMLKKLDTLNDRTRQTINLK